MPMEPADLLFKETAILLFIATLIGVAAARLKQPLIMAFIVTGILFSMPFIPSDEITDHLSLLARMGVVLLLFLVGLKLDIALVQRMGRVALATGIGQILFTSIIGYFICVLLGMDFITSIYVAVALTFSSTIIIVKLLSDKREIETLHGRIAVGFLIVQDIAVIIAMILMTALIGSTSGESTTYAFVSLAVKAFLFLAALALFARFALSRLLRSLAHSQEMLVLFAISWAVLLAAIGSQLGFSKEIGAFLAGVTLASTHFREAIGARLVSLRDFLLLFFFVDLGSKLELSLIGEQILPATVLSLFVLIGNPLIVLVIMGSMGYRKRTGFLAGLTVAQISEFSLILMALGLSAGHIDPSSVGLVTLIGLITIGLSTYMILYSHPLYERLAPYLSVFERKSLAQSKEAAHHAEEVAPPDIILFGLGRYGLNVARRLHQQGHKLLAIDFDPSVIDRSGDYDFPVQYGDAADPEFVSTLPLSGTKWVISTLPDVTTGKVLKHALVMSGYKGRTALTAHKPNECKDLNTVGPDLILLPFSDAAEGAVDRLTSLTRPSLEEK